MFIDQIMVLCRQVSAITLSILIVVMILFATLLIPLSFVTFNEAPETAGPIYWVFFALVATPFVVIVSGSLSYMRLCSIPIPERG